MHHFGNALGPALVGGVVGWAVTAAGILFYYRVFQPSDGNDIRAWQTFSAVMGGFSGALVGLVIGGVYGVVRTRRAAVPPAG